MSINEVPEMIPTQEQEIPILDVTKLGTVLAVWAHPDDEAFLSAGLMARATEAGSRVVCVTATRGEHGTADPKRWPPARLAAVRERELGASLTVLGVKEHHWLGIEDGRCATVSPIAPVATISRLIRDVAADTVVTFGSDGLTGHSDHRAVSQWTTQAWAVSGARGRLLYATCPPGFATRFRAVHDRFSVFERGLPKETPEESVVLRLRLSGELLDRKITALRAHASQTAALITAMGEDLFREWCAEESFVGLPSTPPWLARSKPVPPELAEEAA
ncbi:MAG: PIG-L family deacetylase [Actinomycetota bacterium]|nr:PIG-L family deacetylase [Actinomycetota bacterium]